MSPPPPPPRLLDQRLPLEQIQRIRRLAHRTFDDRHTNLPQNEATIDGIIKEYKIDTSSPIALHDQAAGLLRRAILDGEAHPGERLPPASDLAAVMGVNANTVLRALRILRDEGLLEFRRGRGITVTAAPERPTIVEQARALVNLAHTHGYDTDDLIEMIRRASN